MNYIAERKLLFSEKNSKSRKEVTIKISEPFIVTANDVTFPVDGTMCGCRVEIVGLDEPEFNLYGMDGLRGCPSPLNILSSHRTLQRQR